VNRSRPTLVILVLLSVGLLTLGYRQGATGPLALLQRGAMTIVAPIQDGFAAVVRPIGGFFVAFAQLGQLRNENETLRATLEEADQRRVAVGDLEHENAELRGLLGMQERFGLDTVAAEVIAPPPGALEWRVLVDVGAADGVEAGMAVLNADGLVGKVAEVTRDYAWVELATSPSAGYASRIAENGETGALSGRGPQPFQLEVYDTEAELPADAEIVTQTYAGSRIPDGIPIGRVASPPGGLAQGTRFVEVRPYVDFTALGSVMIVLNAPTRPEAFNPGEIVTDPDAPRPPSLDERPSASEDPSEGGSEGESERESTESAA
jgi:rod shape-determining protein MreC